jgi:hypothetical protein
LLVVMVAQSNAKPTHPRDIGCGVLVDAAHRWHSHTQAAPAETGDHWIISRRGRVSTCAFTRASVHKLLALPAPTYERGHSDGLLGGLCQWGKGSSTERITPFQHIVCLLPFYVRRHGFLVRVDAYVDPDPRFIRR